MTTTKIIYASKDTFISSDSPNLNFGDDLSLFIKNKDNASQYASLIYFDISTLPANAIITAANLELSLFRNDNTEPVTLDIGQPLNYFDEYTTTATNFPRKTQFLVKGDTVEHSLPPLNISITPLVFTGLTNTVSKWYNDPDSNFGFVIGALKEISPVAFSSRECVNTNLRPKLTIDYTINTSISNIETIVSLQKIFPIEKGNETTIYDISKDLFFNYFIYNPKNTPVSITVLSSNNTTGPFTPIGKRYNCPDSDDPNKNSVLVEVLPINKYVCLSVQSISFPTTDTLEVSATHKTFSNMISSSFSSVLLDKDKLAIVLTMTKPLTIISDEKTLQRLATTFTVIIGDKTEPVPVTIAFTTSTQLTLTPKGDTPLDPAKPLTITYKATDEFYLTGINGNVDNITNMELTQATFVRGEAVGFIKDNRFQISLTMSHPLIPNFIGMKLAITVTVKGKGTLAVGTSMAFGSSPTIIPLDIPSVDAILLSTTDILSVSYAPNGVANLKDALGNDIPAFYNKEITNNLVY